MSDVFKLTEDDVIKFLACQTHIGSNNDNFQMKQYIYKRRPDGTQIINLRRTWEKIVLAARAIAAIENPADVCVISARPYGQRAILKFAVHTGATPIAGRFTPGTFTNQIQKAFKEPRLLVVTDPRIDHQAVTEASYVNIPVIAFCNTDSPLRFVDIAIPCNNKGQQSVGLMWWMLAREVLLIKGKINRNTGFEIDDKEIMPDLYFYRDPEEVEKEEHMDKPEPDTHDQGWGQSADLPAAVPEQLGGFETAASTTAPTLPTSAFNPPLGVPVITDWAQETQQWQAEGTPNDQWGSSTQGTWNA